MYKRDRFIYSFYSASILADGNCDFLSNFEHAAIFTFYTDAN
jgi:hypothetical protein